VRETGFEPATSGLGNAPRRCGHRGAAKPSAALEGGVCSQRRRPSVLAAQEQARRDTKRNREWRFARSGFPKMTREASYRSHTGSMQPPQLTPEILDAAIEGFEARKVRIDEQIAQLRQLLNGDHPAATKAEPQKQARRTMSAAARKRIGDAQRKRWAAAGAQTASKTTAKPKRKLSTAGRAAIVAALKKRWAAKKAGLVVVKKAAKKPAPRKAAGKKATTKAAA
jgi:hypothetical protein